MMMMKNDHHHHHYLPYLTLGQVHGREPNKYIPVEKMIEMGLEKLVQQCDSKVRCSVTHISYYYIDVSIICIYELLFIYTSLSIIRHQLLLCV